MVEPPFLPAPPPAKALVALLGPPPQRCLLAGPPGLCRALGRAGHEVTRWQLGPRPEAAALASAEALHVGPLEDPPTALDRFDALILVGALTGLDDPAAALQPLVGGLRPEALVLLLEPAASGPGGQWLGWLLGRFRGQPLLSDASSLAALGLGCGLRDLVQRWPQGLRSLVLTAGRVSPSHAWAQAQAPK